MHTVASLMRAGDAYQRAQAFGAPVRAAVTPDRTPADLCALADKLMPPASAVAFREAMGVPADVTSIVSGIVRHQQMDQRQAHGPARDIEHAGNEVAIVHNIARAMGISR